MFDAKKLLDALGPQAVPAAQPAPAPAPEAAKPADAKPADAKPAEAKPADAKPAAASPMGAGTLLSDLIGLANAPAPPPPPPPAAEGEQPQAKPAKPAAPPPPADLTDLTDLLLRRAQDYLKTPQGNAAVHAVMAGVTKAVVNSEAGRRLTEKAKSKGTALFNRLLNKGAESAAPTIDAEPALPPPAADPAPAALPSPESASAPTAQATQDGETALLVLRAMIAASAADGRIDPTERMRILGALHNAGIDGEGVHVIEAELSRPATAAELAAAVKTPEAAIQVYTAARRIITPNTVEERVFLAHLSGALGLDPRLVAQIDAVAAGAIQG